MSIACSISSHTPHSSTATLVLIGATASGKTELLAELFGLGAPYEGRAEVISADSMQAYRGMDIGTAKPDPALRAVLPHHLIDILDPAEQFTAGDFVRSASAAVEGIRERGRLPIIAGGSGFYIKNLILGMPSSPPADPAIREAVASDLERRGPEALRAELEALDPVSAARIHPNDRYRLTRALEILRSTGRPLASFLPPPREGSDEGGAGEWLVVEYRRPRAELKERIARRVDAMFAAGLVEEVARLRAAGHGAGEPGMKAIGYGEFFALETEGFSGPALVEAARERIKLDTLRYAKRQATFFRGLPAVHVLDAGPRAAADLADLLPL